MQFTVTVVVIVLCIAGNSDINQNKCIEMHVEKSERSGGNIVPQTVFKGYFLASGRFQTNLVDMLALSYRTMS